MSAARPEPVHIDDYAHPRFTDDVRAIRDSVGPLAAELDLESGPVMEQAASECRLDDFGDPTFVPRLDVWLTAMRDEADLDPFGVLSTHAMVLQLLKNRLLITDLLARHPEVRDIQIDRPIVIAGLPRTGTTHLHNLLSADPNLRSLPYWESLEPVPGADDHPDRRLRPRRLRARRRGTPSGVATVRRALRRRGGGVAGCWQREVRIPGRMLPTSEKSP